ncbi:MAG TPA: 50S ribosomal protein L13 [Armatimonadota bacterium]|nr:50S ribosomal protein L13 [Armatimonadota bacterium]
MKTYVPKAGDIRRQWFQVDAAGQSLGRLAVEVAKVLRGKHRPTFTPNADTGDFVIVINADRVLLTGKKSDEPVYHHTGYPGGIKETTRGAIRAKRPIRLIETAIKGMLPHNKIGAEMYRKLKVYPGADHPHTAQQPQPLSVAKPERRVRRASAAK